MSLFYLNSQGFDANKSPEDYDSSTLIDLLSKLPLWVMNPDYERVDWLNKCIHDIWPYFDKSVSNGVWDLGWILLLYRFSFPHSEQFRVASLKETILDANQTAIVHFIQRNERVSDRFWVFNFGEKDGLRVL
ncbi:synaptotagmin-3-like isoform X1 [Olea europaea subsp. europaea]|uniref:Synaptotagmin-3-like isoform X1 n=1 Tax=Olea europaea subsp. europaea TaxID=158383 RepID=A0A8S0P858_OLEEU|nr:synaptotagmin-3-like isoform X1 [Olea europaea subsp. europaea]